LSEEEAHLCPVRAIADWIEESKISNGYVFRRIASGDRIAEANVPMVRMLIFSTVNSHIPALADHSTVS
jgi:hypothetical protein